MRHRLRKTRQAPTLLAVVTLLSCKDPSVPRPHRLDHFAEAEKKKDTVPNANAQALVVVVPRTSVGQVTIGQELSTLSVTKNEHRRVEVPPGISALIEDGKVVDIWIEDLRTLNADVSVGGVLVPPHASLAEIKSALGPCSEVPVKGGMFFNCQSGLSLGTDFAGEGKFIQLRVKPR